jgi:hypothetical protein
MSIAHAGRIVLGFLLLALSGCANMTGSIGLDLTASQSGLACQSDLGAYSLPRKLIRVRVEGGDNGAPFGLEVVEGDYVADADHIYCLDFLASSVADERIGVKRSSANRLLLERVYTKSIDKTLDNAKNLIQATADLAAFQQSQEYERDALLGDNFAGSGTKRQFDFDPFIQSDVRKVNAALRLFGYCIYLRGHGDALVPDWSEGLCESGNGPVTTQSYKSDGTEASAPDYAAIVDERPVSAELRQEGIFYRPEITHVLIIMKQDKPGVRNAPWHRSGSMRVSLPNAAPPFLLRVERSIFVEAQTDVKFKRGVMQSVAVDKKSELSAVSDFAVQVVQSIQKIPAVAVAIFDNSVDNQLALIEANEQLITTLQDYNKARGIETDRESLTPETNALILRGSGLGQRSATQPDPMSVCMQDPAVRDKALREGKDVAVVCRQIVGGNL